MSFSKLSRWLFLILISLLIFFINLKPALDPDLGWHLRTGEYIVTTKTMPHFDPFSHIDQAWVPHEWLSDVLLYLLWAWGGLILLSLVFAFLNIAVFLIASLVFKTEIEYALTASLLGSLASLPILGIRVQIITLLGLALVVFILFRFRQNQKSRIIFFLPLIFLLWVNLHGGFVAGLAALGIFIFLEGAKLFFLSPQVKSFFTKPKINPFYFFNLSCSPLPFKIKKFFRLVKNNALVFLKKAVGGSSFFKENLSFVSFKKIFLVGFLCFLATLLSPYTYKIYLAFLSWGEASYGRESIGEWQPVTYRNLMSWNFILYLVLWAVLVLLCWKKIDITFLGLMTAFAFLSFSSWRHMPLLIVIATPLWAYFVRAKTHPVLLGLLKQRFILFIFLIACFLTGYQQIDLALKTDKRPDFFAEKGGFPYQAVEHIKANPEAFQGNMFNEYNWGGYLVWQLPQKKVFIDGRMIDIEVFKEYNQIKELKNQEELLEKYGINWAFIYSQSLLDFYLPYNGWEEAYRDELAVIYIKI